MMMSRIRIAFLFVTLSICVCSNGWAETGKPSAMAEENTAGANDEVAFAIGGCGGAYFLASPGELVVEVHKRDRNRRGRRADLRAILVGPDRQVIREVAIPDDGQPRGSGLGPLQWARLSTRVERKGVYGLNITVSQDRYGEEIVWGFRTNCPHYMIETSRGHRDERHQEPIVLLNPGRPGDVCFVPRKDSFRMDIANLPDDVGAIELYDEEGKLIEVVRVDANGQASHTIDANVHRDSVPWRLHLPSQQATVQIDGVTRWETGDLYANLSYWTPDPAAYFPFQMYRWILTPYSRTVYGRPGEQGEIAFQVHNNANQKKTFQLDVEFPDREWPAELSSRRVTLGAKKNAEISVRYTPPAEGETRVWHLRVTPTDRPDFSTYSTLTVKAGLAPATKPLDMPLVLKPYRHENEQFGYLPDYPVQNQMYFGSKNRPFAKAGGEIATCRDGQWMTSNLRTSVQSGTDELANRTFGMIGTKIAFDRAGDVYVLAMAGSTAALLCSDDGGKTFSACAIPGREGQPRTFDIEQFSGHNTPDSPPPVVRFARTGGADARLRWRRINDLELLLPDKVDGRLSMGKPILISKRCIGLSSHSGIPASVVSRGTKVHVAWAEATDPSEKVPGVPTFVATCDRETGQLGDPVLVGYGAPPNDVHNSPSITMDSQGYLHVLAGTHGQPFQYAKSLKPNDAHSGWTDAVPVGEGLRQTYIGFVCGADDTLHLVFRFWRYGTEPHPASYHATLAYQRKRPGQPWEEPRVLIVSPFSEYSIFYHRLTIDRAGRLFLSYDYWSTHWFYRNDHYGSRRVLLMSEDGGDTWKFAHTSDFH